MRDLQVHLRVDLPVRRADTWTRVCGEHLLMLVSQSVMLVSRPCACWPNQFCSCLALRQASK